MDYKDQTITGERIIIDGCKFDSCELKNCTLVYEGGGAAQWTGSTVDGCKWEIAGSAKRTTDFLSWLGKVEGMEDFLEATFDSIRRGALPTAEDVLANPPPTFPDTPLESILRDIQRALDRRMPYLAVAVALSIPDVCAAMERTPPNSKQQHYKAWCDAYLIPHYTVLTSADCYRMRCGVLHQGHFGNPDNTYDRLFLSVRYQPGGIVMDEMFMEHVAGIPDKVLQLDGRKFCETMIAAARAWYTAMANDPHVQANMPNVVSLWPNGFHPYVIGVPCIA